MPSTVGTGEDGSPDGARALVADGDVLTDAVVPPVSWEDPPFAAITIPATAPATTTPPAATSAIRRLRSPGTDGITGPGSSPGGMSTGAGP
ncbi:hypothetical protein ACFQ51_14825 [Streptomyces kaempferi]